MGQRLRVAAPCACPRRAGGLAVRMPGAVRKVGDAHKVSGKLWMPTEVVHIAEVVRAQTP